MLRAAGSAFCDITQETRGTVCYTHETGRGYFLLQALCSVACDIIHETGGTICCGHWILRLVISHRSTYCYQTRDTGHDLLQALDSASADITHELRSTICCMKEWVRFVSGIL